MFAVARFSGDILKRPLINCIDRSALLLSTLINFKYPIFFWNRQRNKISLCFRVIICQLGQFCYGPCYSKGARLTYDNRSRFNCLRGISAKTHNSSVQPAAIVDVAELLSQSARPWYKSLSSIKQFQLYSVFTRTLTIKALRTGCRVWRLSCGALLVTYA